MVLTKKFLNKMEAQAPTFGFGDMGEFIMLSKYSKLKENGEKETWHEVLQRNVEGLFWIMDEYLPNNNYTKKEKQKIAEQLYISMFKMRFLPAGRPLANLGRGIITERRLGASLNNCAFISFNAVKDISEGFEFVLDMSMLGVGVGINVAIKKPPKLHNPNIEHYIETFKIPDTREGWVEAIRKLVTSYTSGVGHHVAFDYSLIRPKGALIKGMGGVHPGFEPFEEMLEKIRTILTNNDYADSRVIADICNLIGKCVVNGGQRRTALLLLGDPTDDKFVSLKDYEANPERAEFGWTSNNSPYGFVGMNYDTLTPRIKRGEDLGIVWLDNARKYGRMDGTYSPDSNVGGFNPCVEMQLEPFELCNLMEINPNKFSGENYDYTEQTIWSAVFFAKVVSAMPTHWEKTNDIISRNRRFGISQTGITEYISKIGLDKYVGELDEWYDMVQEADRKISERLGISKSIRTTTVKPSGTISKLMGTTAGIHYATSRYLLRRVRVDKGSGYGEYYRSKGYHVEQDVYNSNSEVITFPVDHGDVKTIDDVSMYDQFNLATVLQKHWSDNAVSITVSVKENELDYIGNALDHYQFYLKCASFLKIDDVTQLYKQVPEEPISAEQYKAELWAIQDRKRLYNSQSLIKLADAKPDAYCSTDKCDFEVFNNDLLHK